MIPVIVISRYLKLTKLLHFLLTKSKEKFQILRAKVVFIYKCNKNATILLVKLLYVTIYPEVRYENRFNQFKNCK